MARGAPKKRSQRTRAKPMQMSLQGYARWLIHNTKGNWND